MLIYGNTYYVVNGQTFKVFFDRNTNEHYCVVNGGQMVKVYPPVQQMNTINQVPYQYNNNYNSTNNYLNQNYNNFNNLNNYQNINQNMNNDISYQDNNAFNNFPNNFNNPNEYQNINQNMNKNIPSAVNDIHDKNQISDNFIGQNENEETPASLLWCGSKGRFEKDYNELKIDQIDFLSKLQVAVIATRDKQIKNLQARLNKKTRQNHDKDVNSESLALTEGYTAIGTDFHGDIYSLYSFLVNNGYLIPDNYSFRIINFVTGGDHGEFDRNEVNIRAERLSKSSTKYSELLESNENLNGQLTALPGFEINSNFKGKVKLLGDYVDRGRKSAMCLAMIDYLAQKDPGHFNAHYGNHETFEGSVGILYFTNDNFKQAIDRMKISGSLTLGSLEPQGNNGKYTSYSHTSLCKKHVPKMLGILIVFANLETNLQNPVFMNNVFQVAGATNYNKWMALYNKQASKYKELKESNGYSALGKKIDSLSLSNPSAIKKLSNLTDFTDPENFESACEYFKDAGFEEKDYFTLRNFISDVMEGNFDEKAITDTESRTAKAVGSYINFLYCSNYDKSNSKYKSYFECIDTRQRGSTFLDCERYAPKLDEQFETIDQVQGHTNTKADEQKDASKNPFVVVGSDKIEDRENSNIYCFDNSKGVGFREDFSISSIPIQCPNKEGGLKNSLALENFEVSRTDGLPSNDVKIVDTGISGDREKGKGGDLKKRDNLTTKKFQSLKKITGAFGLDIKTIPLSLVNNLDTEIKTDVVLNNMKKNTDNRDDH